jgi:hypothetical protein
MPYQMGLALGAAQQPGQSAGAQSYFGGQMQGAQTQYGATMAAQQMNNQFLSSLISAGAQAYNPKPTQQYQPSSRDFQF